MEKYKCDILNLEWVSNGRDAHIVEPVLVSLEDRYGYRIVRKSVWFALFKILWYRPKVFFMSNDIGAENNVSAYHFANKLGIRTITLISEGLPESALNENHERLSTEQMFWGDNYKKEKYWDLKIIWSPLMYERFKRWIPDYYLNEIKVCGGSGFDRYTLFQQYDTELTRDKLDIHTKKTILIVGYGFDVIHRRMLQGYDFDGEYQKIFTQKDIVRDIYRELINNNTNITFILKYHPGMVNKEDYEFYGIDDAPNVVVIKNEIEISKLIAVSDLIICFDSTTALESWLMHKLTIFVNPIRSDFIRPNMFKGAIVVRTYDELASTIHDFYDDGIVVEYENKEDIRRDVIRETISHGDGFNYLRISKEIDIFMKTARNKKKNLSLKLVCEISKELLYESATFLIERTPLGHIKPHNKRFYRMRSKLYNYSERDSVQALYRKSIKQFEKTNSMKVEEILASK